MLDRRKALQSLAAGMATAITGLAPCSAATSDSDAIRQAALKINLSGRQRMLTQRMAKAAGFVHLGMDAPKHLTVMRQARDLFAKSLQGLSHGDDDLGLRPEPDPGILAELKLTEDLWDPYAIAIHGIQAAGQADKGALARVAELNMPLLVQANKAVTEFQRKYGSTAIHPELAGAINVAGRQRMLTQKASKEFCLIAAGLDAEANRQALAGTIALFDSSLASLIAGDAETGIIAPFSDELIWQYSVIEELWTAFKPSLSKAARGGPIDEALTNAVMSQNDPLLDEMNAAVWMY